MMANIMLVLFSSCQTHIAYIRILSICVRLGQAADHLSLEFQSILATGLGRVENARNKNICVQASGFQ